MYIGIDLGTSGVKVILVDRQGTVKRTVSKSYPLLIPQPSWSEQNPKEWVDKTLEALQELVMGYESSIKAIGFSGQMHGLVLLDQDDNVLRNALLWNDQRTIKEVEYLQETIGIETLLEETGNIALTGLTAPKVLWVRNNEPELFQQISKVMLPKDYLIYTLTGTFASDVSDASGTLYFNPATKQYSDKMLDILGITTEMLPSIHESYDVVGTLNKDICQQLGLPEGIKVVPGGGDQAVGAVGTGTVHSNECSISLGTSGVIFVSSDHFAIDHNSYLQSYAHANGKYHMMAVMLNAAGAMKWWNESVFDTSDYDAFYHHINETRIDNDIFFLPYLTGERAPINDPYAKGVLYGLQLQHNKADIDRAVVEGVTFALKDSFELIKQLGTDITRIRVTGGGAKSPVWTQMIADIMNVEVVRLAVEEGPALGAAILAMVGAKEYSNVEAACDEIITLADSFVPNPEASQLYQQKYEKFSQLYPTVKQLFRRV